MTLRNTGEWPATISRLLVNGLSSPDVFTIIADGCIDQYLDIGDECQFALQFSPPDEGQHRANIRLSYGAFETNQLMVGTTPTGIPAIDYGGPQEITITTEEEVFRRITITNKGPVPLNVLSSVFVNGFVLEILDTNCSEASINPGDFCFFDLRIAVNDPVFVGIFPWASNFISDSYYNRFAELNLRINVENIPTP